MTCSPELSLDGLMADLRVVGAMAARTGGRVPSKAQRPPTAAGKMGFVEGVKLH
jgi:hypothetical protein